MKKMKMENDDTEKENWKLHQEEENLLERLRLESKTLVWYEILVLESPCAFERQSGRLLANGVSTTVMAVYSVNIYPQWWRGSSLNIIGIVPAGSTWSWSSSSYRSLSGDRQMLLL